MQWLDRSILRELELSARAPDFLCKRIDSLQLGIQITAWSRWHGRLYAMMKSQLMMILVASLPSSELFLGSSCDFEPSLLVYDDIQNSSRMFLTPM